MTSVTVAQRLFRSDDPKLRFLPEGPYPLATSQFSWVAIQHGADAQQGSLNVFDWATLENRNFLLPGRPGFAFPCQDPDQFVVGCERQLGLFRISDSAWQPWGFTIEESVENTIINDAVVFGDNLIFGCKDLQFQTSKAGLYLLRGSDCSLLRLRDDQVCSNGKAVVAESPSEVILYDIDSPTRQIVRYRLNLIEGSLSAAEVVLDLRDDPAVPDGMILTPDGSGVIVSMFNPNPAPHGETRLYDLASGGCLQVWQTPGSPQNTCPQLVAHQGKVWLVITTAAENMNDQQRHLAPEAGSLFFAPTDFESTGSPPRYTIPDDSENRLCDPSSVPQ